MSFQLDQRIDLPGPAADHPRQRGQQQVVDLGAVGGRRFLQQLPGRLGVQSATDRTGMAVALVAQRVEARQVAGGALQLPLPVRQFAIQAAVTGKRPQALGPIPEGAGLGR